MIKEAKNAIYIAIFDKRVVYLANLGSLIFNIEKKFTEFSEPYIVSIRTAVPQAVTISMLPFEPTVS